MKTVNFFSWRVHLYLAMGTLCVAPNGAQASSETLPTIVVNARGSSAKVQDVIASTQVLTQEQIQSFSGTGLPQILTQASGVDARAQGSNNSVVIRGFSVRPGALLINGLRRPGKYAGINPGLLELNNIRQVDIVRGPMSALYGADATGGAINIWTRSALDYQDQGGHVEALYGALPTDGQRGTFIGRAGLHFGSERVRHQLSLESKNRRRFSYEKDAVPADLGDLKQQFFTYDGGVHVDDTQALLWTLEYMDQHDSYPSRTAAANPRSSPQSFKAYEKETRWFTNLAWEKRLQTTELRADIAYGHSKGSTTRSFPLIEDTLYHQWQAQLRGISDIDQHQLAYGAGWINDKIDITTITRQATRDNFYLYAQDEWHWHRNWTLLTGLRYDQFTDFGQQVTPRTALQFQQGSYLVRLGYGQAYRAPTVLEQYSTFTRGPSLIVGNPNLKAEKNRAWELSFQYEHAWGEVGLSVFDNRVNDLVATVAGPPLSGDAPSVRSRHVYTNIDKAVLRGGELRTEWRLGEHWNIQAGWDYLDARDAETKERLSGLARQIARLSVQYQYGPWTANLHHRHYFDFYAADPSLRNATPFNSRYGSTDLKLRYQLTRQWQLYTGIDNLFNQRQPINFGARGVTMDPPARFAYAGVRYEF